MKFIRNICLMSLFAASLILGACGDVEGAGEPQPRVPRVEVESENYYVQIVQENINGVALYIVGWIWKQHRNML